MKKRRKRRRVISNIISLLIISGILVFIYSIVFPPGSWLNLVTGSSMYPTLHDKQVVFTDMSDKIKRGDIVTAWMRADVTGYKEDILVIKRVIGLPMEKVYIDSSGVYINGEVLEETYLGLESKRATYREKDCNEIILTEDEYYVMGDNRAVSYDSRKYGVLEEEDILYVQSEKVTRNFWIKLVSSLFIVCFCLILYLRLEMFIYSIVRRFL